MKLIVALDNGGHREIVVEQNETGAFVVTCHIWRRKPQTFDKLVDALLYFQELMKEYESNYGNNYALRMVD